MARLPRLIALAPLLALTSVGFAQPADDAAETPDEPRYLRAVRHELERMGVDAECEAEGRARAECTFTHTATEPAGRWAVRMVVSDRSHSVYLAVLDLARVAPNDERTGGRLRLLAELNWAHTGTHLDWDPRTGAVRLSAIQRTDTNFDRRAFRVLLRLLLSRAERLAPQLR